MKNNFTKRILLWSILLYVIAFSSCSTDIENKSSFGNGEGFRDTGTTAAEATTTERTKKQPFTTTVPVSEENEQANDSEATDITLAFTESTAETTAPTAEITTTAETTAMTTAETTVKTTEETAIPVADSDDTYNVMGDNGILVSYMDGHYRGLMPCFGTYGFCDDWIDNVNEFAEKLPDVKVYNMVVPTSSEFYIAKGYETGFTASQYNKISYIAEGLKNVTDIDAYSVLKEHTNEEIYSRTDHHWFPLGAYYAAGAFAERAEIDFPDLSEYKEVSCGGYVGSLYSYSNDVHLYNDPENFVMYISPNSEKLKTTYYNTSFKGGYEGDLFVSPNASAYYCSFLGGDSLIAEIETDVKNGRTLVIFKESYGNALVPFLTSGFEKIYVCDIRYFTPNAVDFCKEVGATDLLFGVCTYTPAGTNGKYLGYILNQ